MGMYVSWLDGNLIYKIGKYTLCLISSRKVNWLHVGSIPTYSTKIHVFGAMVAYRIPNPLIRVRPFEDVQKYPYDVMVACKFYMFDAVVRFYLGIHKLCKYDRVDEGMCLQNTLCRKTAPWVRILLLAPLK